MIDEILDSISIESSDSRLVAADWFEEKGFVGIATFFRWSTTEEHRRKHGYLVDLWIKLIRDLGPNEADRRASIDNTPWTIASCRPFSGVLRE